MEEHSRDDGRKRSVSAEKRKSNGDFRAAVTPGLVLLIHGSRQ